MTKPTAYDRRRAVWLMGLVGAGLTSKPALSLARSKTFLPSKTITLVVPFEAGGTVDPVARSLAQHLTATLGRTVIVENRPGATGAIGANHVARSAPDGHTLLVGPGTVMVVNPLVSPTQYDVARDFRPVGLLVGAELVFVTNPSTGFRTMEDVIRYAKQHPGKLPYASNGQGGTFHLATEHLQDAAGIELLHIPYKGGSATETAMLRGEVGLMLANTAYVLPRIRSGQLVALAIASPGRSRKLPGVPSVSGTVPGYEANTWVGLYAPAGTSDEIIARLNAATNAFLNDPGNAESMRSKGLEPLPGSPADALRFHTQEQVKWGRIVSLAKAKGRLN